MSTFEFKCPECGDIRTVSLPAGTAPGEQECRRCRIPMLRVWGVAGVNYGARATHSAIERFQHQHL